MVPVTGLILFTIAWFFPGNLQPGTVYGNGFFYLPENGWLYVLWTGMNGLPLWVQIAPSCLTAILTATQLVRNDLDNTLMGTRSYAMAFVFLFLVTSNGHFFLFHPAMLAGLFMVLSYRFLLDLYKDENEYSLVFAMSFSWGVAILLYPPILLLFPAILAGLLLMVTTNWRHWLVCLMGVATPILIASVTWFLIGNLDYEIVTFLSWFELRHVFIPAFISREPFITAWLGLILLITVFGSWKYRNPKIQSRQLFQANFVLFLSILLMTVLLERTSTEVLWLLVIPVTYLMTFWALKVEKPWRRDLFFFSLLLFFAFFRIIRLV
jgi:hypothetical protein